MVQKDTTRPTDNLTIKSLLRYLEVNKQRMKDEDVTKTRMQKCVARERIVFPELPIPISENLFSTHENEKQNSKKSSSMTS